MSHKKEAFAYVCYAIILCENCLESNMYPAFIVCWDNRVHEDSQVFTLHRLGNVQNPVLTQTYDDIYELKELYKRFRFSVRDKNGEPRKTYIKGILVAIPCNEKCTIFSNTYYYISHINNEPGNPNDCLARWQNIYLEKEKNSYSVQDNWPELLSYEDGYEIKEK